MLGRAPSAAGEVRVAVACSGLGHVQRGVEAWAEDMGRALRKHGVPSRLFGVAGDAIDRPIACFRRTSAAARRVAKLFERLGGWRYGMGSPYEVEQTSFVLGLWRQVCRDYDVLHVQDPTLARMMQAAHRMGLSRPRVILANGTGEPLTTLRRFDCLQHLTPSVATAWEAHRPPGQATFTVPNFIDPSRFTPGDRVASRAQLGLPQDRLIVFCCAAIKRHHKRIDVLLEEFARANRACDGRMLLVIAGGREQQTDEVLGLAERLLGDGARILVDLPRPEVNALYRAADVFVLTSLFETFGIVLLEAMSSGLPVICHDTPDFAYVTGPGALRRDLAHPGSLAEALLAMLEPETRLGFAAAARRHVKNRFSDEAVIPMMVQMYRTVAGKPASPV